MTTDYTPALAVGDRVRFGYPYGDETRRWWTIRAVDERFTVLTRQADFRKKGESFYTVIDRQRGVRGPINLIGQGWDIDEPNGPERLLRALQRHGEIAEIVRRDGTYTYDGPDDIAVEVSYRNNVPIDIAEVSR